MEGSASQAGFYYQNNVAALKMIDCLFFESDIVDVKLDNYDKGNHIDDIIIYGKERAEYYQIKWSEDGDNSYTLYNLITCTEPKKSIFRQLAEGYLSVKNTTSDFSITLFTTKRESNQKRPGDGIHSSLKEIRTQIIEPLQQQTIDYTTLPAFASHRDALEKIRVECWLSEADFQDFLKRLVFRFSQEPVEQIRVSLESKFEKLGIEKSLVDKLLDNIVKWSITGESVTKSKLLVSLGLTNRFEDKLSHYFRIVDDKHYVPNQDFFDKLNEALTTLSGGYIFIEGLPGIGKSTALTKFKESHPDITLAYYCFIPDTSHDFGALRHKGEYFLKSLCIAIENNFRDVDLPERYSDRFAEKLASYIEALAYLERKIFFIVDGLDHVHRDLEFTPESLLNNIKGELPDNIYFILSSQYGTVLSESVKAQISADPRRHIRVPRFSHADIYQYLESKGIRCSDPFLNQIEKTSVGIPLYLHYISELLRGREQRDYEEVLQELPVLSKGTINAYHEYLYRKVEEDGFVRWVLAILAYRKEYTNSETLREILALVGISKDIIEIETVLRRHSHLLRQADGRGFLIFHNSFREFLLNKTPSLKQKFNEALVSYYEKHNTTDEAHRNYFSHLFALGEYNKILSATKLKWMKQAWSDFRPIVEIKQNIEIAIQASIESLQLSEFIRIGFLKAQLDTLSHNLDGSDIDLPTLLLRANLEGHSLRNIWDGDFVTVTKNYFIAYLKEYYKGTGLLLPENIIRQGLFNRVGSGNEEDVTKMFQAESLLTNDIVKLFEDIDSYSWTRQSNRRPDSVKKEITPAQVEWINKKIKLRIITYLKETGKHKELYQLFQQKDFDSDVQTFIQAALIQLLLPSAKSEALGIAKQFDRTLLTDKLMSQFISNCADYLSNEELIQLSGGKKIAVPSIHEKIIDETKGMRYGIHEDITELFQSLKPVQVFHPEKIPVLLLKVSMLRTPAKEIYEAIFDLSDLWYRNRTGNPLEPEKISAAKRILTQLCLKKLNVFRKTSYGLFDSPTDENFTRRDIHKIFSVVFSAFTRVLSSRAVAEVTDYWIDISGPDNRYDFYKNELEVAKILDKSQPQELSDRIIRLLQNAETSARREEDTSTLLNYLGDTAEGYGLCGYTDDFKRIYNGLFDTAFGVYYRKDYQAAYIVRALEAMHKKEPSGTLRRLAEVFSVQQQLAQAGNSRMHHIVLSDLITFAATHYSELGFLLLTKEESDISRAETIEMMMEPLIEKTGKEELPLFFSIVKTLPKWSKSDGAHDNHFLSTSEALLDRALQLKEDSFVASLLKHVSYNAEVELGDRNELKRFSELLTKYNVDHKKYGLPAPISGLDKQQELRKKNKDKFYLLQGKYNVNDWVQLFKTDYSAFTNQLAEEQKKIIKNRMNHAFRHEYNQSKTTFEKFYGTLPESERERLGLQRVIRYFIEFKHHAILAVSSDRVYNSDIQPFLIEFVEKTNELFRDNQFKQFLEEDLDEENWLSNLLRAVNYLDYGSPSPLGEEDVFAIVEEASLMETEKTLEFLHTWTSGSTTSAALVKLARKLFLIDPEEAKKILSKVAGDKRDNSLFSGKKDSEKSVPDVLITALENDRSFGKRLLLQCFRAQRGNYADSFLSGVPYLIKYGSYFKGEEVETTYYDANLQYNKELSEGLPPKSADYDFVVKHTESLSLDQTIIRYLVAMLDYPVVKVRELALQSLFDLAVEDKESYLKEIISCGTRATDNGIEYWVVVLQAFELAAPGRLIPYKAQIWEVLNRSHFNISASAKALLLLIDEKNPGFLSKEEIAALQLVNAEGVLVSPPRLVHNQKAGKFVFSSYQSSLLYKLSSNEDDDTLFQDDVYTDLVNRGWKSYSSDEESALHRRYNINGNFDTIEIQSDYYRAVQRSINTIFADKIKLGCFNRDFTADIARMFRVYDPTRLLYRPIARPAYINWLPDGGVLEEEFLDFDDFDALLQEFAGRESDFITLFEKGSQRSEDRSKHNFATYFEVYAYAKKKGFDDSGLEEGRYAPVIEAQNLYSSEMPFSHLNFRQFPIPGVLPMLETSVNKFRGEEEGTQANLLRDILSRLKISQTTLLDIMTKNHTSPLLAFTWQDAYTSGSGRRRYKPNSDGFTLKIERGLLTRYLQEKEMILCYYIRLRRSATKYTPEKDMEWYEMSKRFEIDKDKKANSG